MNRKKARPKKIDLQGMEGSGEFPCPTCGVLIDPGDESETIYEVEDVGLEEETVQWLLLKCKKCDESIKIVGFSYIPPDKTDIQNKFMRLVPLFERLGEEVCFIIQRKIDKQEIRIHDITSRVKKFESFYQKILSKESKKPFEDINDISGVRIICLYRADLEKIQEIISKEFRIVSMDTSRTKPMSSFGYMSDHYIVRLPKELKGERYDDLKELLCEIQVRTILMHAWATVSHHLDYKREMDIPSNLKTDFHALSGLFYVADTHFELFKDNVAQLRSMLGKSVESGEFNLSQEVNLDSFRAYVEWKFPKRKDPVTGDFSTLVNQLKNSGYDTIKDLDIGVEKGKDAIHSQESLYGQDISLNKADAIKVAISYVNPQFKKEISKDLQKRKVAKKGKNQDTGV